MNEYLFKVQVIGSSLPLLQLSSSVAVAAAMAEATLVLSMATVVPVGSRMVGAIGTPESTMMRIASTWWGWAGRVTGDGVPALLRISRVPC